VIELIVNDGTVNSVPDTISITAITPFSLPDTGQTASYTSIFGEDSDYSINPMSFIDNGDGTITDNITDLVWQKEDNDIDMTWDDALNYCAVLTIDEYSDWRLPSINELSTIVHFGSNSPSIDSTYFPNTNFSNNESSYYWSSTEYAFDTDFANTRDFRLGGIGYRYKIFTGFVRCVRGKELPFGYFNDNGDNTITDIGTSLMWQKENGGEIKWLDAIEYCENLSLAGHNDWRAPNVKEIETISDFENHHPSIYTTYFPDTGSHSQYWASTVLDAYSSYAWYISYEGGCSNSMIISSNKYVRCVRNIE